MKKQILNLGKSLSKAEQKKVFGGNVFPSDDGGGCLSAGALCHTGVTNPDLQCCGTCGNVSRGWGICE